MDDRWFAPSDPKAGIPSVPWIHPDAVEYLGLLVEAPFRVLEHGSGGSTRWLAARCHSVTAYEINEAWRGAVAALGLPNVTLKDSHYPHENMEQPFDLLFIDGEPLRDRAVWLAQAVTLVKPGGYVVLDNANRPDYEREREKLGKAANLIQHFKEPRGQFLVTEFYKVKE